MAGFKRGVVNEVQALQQATILKYIAAHPDIIG
jgi:hypothetical protein